MILARAFLFLAVAGELLANAAIPLVFEQRTPTHFVARTAEGLLDFSSHGFRFSSRFAPAARVAFPGARRVRPAATGDQGRAHYFARGRQSDFGQFERLTYANLYPGIDLVLYGDGQRLEYDFRVAPGASVASIAMTFPDTATLLRSNSGELLAGDLRHQAPVAYQLIDGRRSPVDVGWRLTGKVARFEVGAYDHARTLVIDPVLLYSDAIGGSGRDSVAASAMDSHDNLYVFGQTTSVDFPVVGGFRNATPGAALLQTSDGHTVLPVRAGPANDVEAIAGTGNGSTLYISAANATLRSDNGGISWVTALPGLPAVARQLAVDAGDARTVFAATDRGLYKSTDGGQHWVERDAGFPLSTDKPAVGMVSTHPSRAGMLFAGTSTATFRSIDGGETWTRIGSVAESVAFGAGHTVFITSTAYQTLRSDDDGDTWVTTALIGTQYPQSLAIAPDNPSVLYLANALGFYRSSDAGVTFQLLGLARIPNLQGAFVDPGNPQRLCARDDTHVYTSGDGGVTWNTLLSGYLLHSLYIAPGKLFIGSTVQANLFITKWDPINRHIIYSSYLGGLGQDTAVGLALDPLGNAYLAATTDSPDMPLSSNAAEKSSAGQSTGYVAKISADGSQLLYGSYFNEGQPYAIGADSQGSLYLTGTKSAVLKNCTRISNNPFLTLQSNTQVFVEKWKADFSAPVYATVLGGSCGEYPYAMTVDAAGSAWITGTTYSPDLPTTATAIQPAFQTNDSTVGNRTSGFLAALNPAGDKITYATYLGQSVTNSGRAVALDGKGNVYVTGNTWGFPFPTSPGALRPQIQASCQVIVPIIGGYTPNGGSDAFVIRLNPANASDYKFTYLGGSCDDSGTSIKVDPAGQVWVAGTTNSGNFQTMTPFDGIGTAAGFVAELSGDLTTLLYSSFAPQSSVTVDSAGDAVLAGGGITISRIDGHATPPVEIDAVLNFNQPTVPPLYYSGYGIAPGEMVRITGQNLGPQFTIPGQFEGPLRITSQVGGIQVLFDGVPAPLLQLQAQQILCMAPFALDGKSTTQVVVVNGTQRSNPVNVGVVAKSMDLLALLNQDFTLNAAANPAALGSVVTLYVDGLGQTSPAGMDGQVDYSPLPLPLAPVKIARMYDSVTGNGTDLTITFQAAAYGMVAGITQINARLPAVYTGANPATLVLDNGPTVMLYLK